MKLEPNLDTNPAANPEPVLDSAASEVEFRI